MPNRYPSPKAPIDLIIQCVVLSSFQSEFAFLRNVLRLAGIRMHHAESLEEADFLLTVTPSTVLLSDVVFADGFWHNALSLVAKRHPLVTMLVIADRVDRPFLGDLFERGACGIIWKPFEFDAVRRLIRAVHEASKERQLLYDESGLLRNGASEPPPVVRISEGRSFRPIESDR